MKRFQISSFKFQVSSLALIFLSSFQFQVSSFAQLSTFNNGDSNAGVRSKLNAAILQTNTNTADIAQLETDVGAALTDTASTAGWVGMGSGGNDSVIMSASGSEYATMSSNGLAVVGGLAVDGVGLNSTITTATRSYTKGGWESGRTNLGVVLTITDDGNYDVTKSLFTPVFQSLGVPGCIAATTQTASNWGTGHTPAECKVLVDDYGFEIISHSVTHPSLQLASNSVATIDYEMRQAQEWIEAAGIECRNFAYPFGHNDEVARAIAKKYYRSAGEVTLGVPQLTAHPEFTISYPPIAQYTTPRIYFTSAANGFTMQTFTNLIDKAVSDGECWMQMYCHAFYAAADWGTQEAWSNNLHSIISYAISQGVEVLTVNDALDRFSNTTDLGDYQALTTHNPNYKVPTDENYHYVIGADGSFSSSDMLAAARYETPRMSSDFQHLSTAPITDWPDRKITIESYGTSSAAAYGWPEAGTLITWRLAHDSSDSGNGWQWQDYHAFDGNRQYKRAARYNGSWEGWSEVSYNDAEMTLIASATTNFAAGTFTTNETKNFNVSVDGDISLMDNVIVTPERHLEDGLIVQGYVYSSSGDVRIKLTSLTAQTISARDYKVLVIKDNL